MTSAALHPHSITVRFTYTRQVGPRHAANLQYMDDGVCRVGQVGYVEVSDGISRAYYLPITPSRKSMHESMRSKRNMRLKMPRICLNMSYTWMVPLTGARFSHDFRTPLH